MVKHYIDREEMDNFKCDLVEKFAELCYNNDYNKLNLLTIGDVIESIYSEYLKHPSAKIECEYEA